MNHSVMSVALLPRRNARTWINVWKAWCETDDSLNSSPTTITLWKYLFNNSNNNNNNNFYFRGTPFAWGCTDLKTTSRHITDLLSTLAPAHSRLGPIPLPDTPALAGAGLLPPSRGGLDTPGRSSSEGALDCFPRGASTKMLPLECFHKSASMRALQWQCSPKSAS